LANLEVNIESRQDFWQCQQKNANEEKQIGIGNDVGINHQDQTAIVNYFALLFFTIDEITQPDGAEEEAKQQVGCFEHLGCLDVGRVLYEGSHGSTSKTICQ